MIQKALKIKSILKPIHIINFYHVEPFFQYRLAYWNIFPGMVSFYFSRYCYSLAIQVCFLD